MKKYLIPLFILSACNSSPPKLRHFICMTPFGVAQLDSDNPNVKVGWRTLTLEQENQTVTVNRAVCVDVVEK